MIVSIEGVDGVGKTTLVNELAKLLEEKGATVTTISLPTRVGTIGKFVRCLLSSGNLNALTEYTQRQLFLLDRVEELQRKNLPDTDIVITDRHITTNAAYQEGGNVVDVEQEMVLLETRLGVAMPDVVYVLQAPLEFIMQELNSREAKEAYETLDKVSYGLNRYNELVSAKNTTLNYVGVKVMDGRGERYTPSQLAEQVYLDMLLRRTIIQGLYDEE